MLKTNVASNTASITANTAAINLKASAADLATLTINVTSNTASITSNIADIAILKTNVASNTASITANNAAINLKAPIASPSFTGTVTTDQINTGVLSATSVTTPVYASTPITLNYTGSTINWNPSLGLNTAITLTQNSGLNFSAAPPVGSYGTVVLTQDVTGSRTITLPTIANVTNKILGSTSSSTVTLSTAANAQDILNFYYDGSNCYWNVGQGYGAAASSLSGNTNLILTTTGTGSATLSGTTLNIPSSGLPTSGNTAGDMLYWNGSAWVKVSAGTNGQTLTFYNGAPVWTGTISYANTVTNLTTGKIWMDRNLGASQGATSLTDAASFGDLYQWGRGTDGHEKRTSVTTNTLSSSDVPGDAIFITTTNGDWRSTKNDILWQGLYGINNPCPSGYRLPTYAEWVTESTSWTNKTAAGAFASPLKLPMAGYRRETDGSLSNASTWGFYNSSTVDGANFRILFFISSFAGVGGGSRADGRSVRCIKD